MGKINAPPRAKLFIGMLTSLPEILPKATERLASFFGEADSRSELYPFDLTHYYDETMGTPIYRHFLSFAGLIEPSTLADIKIRTNEMESAMAVEYGAVHRPINLDPGYLELSKIVLASTKNFYHRILISRGIYAEVTLHFEKEEWRSFPWTFPDFRTGRYHPYFLSLRELYKAQLAQCSRA
jgi:hypothetical protein